MKILLKGQIYRKSNKQVKRYKRISFLPYLKRRITRRLERQFNPAIRQKRRRNLFQRSYFKKFILRRRPRKRFFLRISRRIRKENDEKTLFIRLNNSFRKAELKRMRKTLFRKTHYFLPLSKRSFSYGKLHITNRRRNTFCTYSHGDIENRLKQSVRFKASCGMYYQGPKKITRFSRETVLRNVAFFVGNDRASHLDIFLRGHGRIYKHLLKAFRIEPIYIRYLFITRRRSHGFTRAKKLRRT